MSMRSVTPPGRRRDETFFVLVGGARFRALTDKLGTERFIGSTVVDWIVASDDQLLNRLALAYASNLRDHAFVQRDYVVFYTMLGYSLSGFCDLSEFKYLEVATPKWTRGGKRPWERKGRETE